MKLTIEQKSLAALLSKVVGAVEKRNTIPILANVLLATDEGILKATATDMDMSVTSRVEADVQTHGAATVNAALAAGIVAKMAKGALITIEASAGHVKISNGKASFDLASLDAEDFPELASDNFTARTVIPAFEMKRMLDLSAFAQSTEETRYFLNGIYLHSADGILRAVATDGHRLAQIDSEHHAEIPGVIVPRKTVAELRKMDAGDLTLEVSATKIKVSDGSTELLSKVIDGTFPDYTRVIPQAHKTRVVADAAEIKAASDLVAMVSGERSKGVRMAFTGGRCDLEVTSGVDTANETVATEQEGPDVVTGFNAKYLAEAMAHVNGGRVVMNLGASGDPAVIQPEDDALALWVIMPMRVV